MIRAMRNDATASPAGNLVLGGRPLLDLVREVQDLYLADGRPWVVGFSGGKDSTAIVQLIYAAVRALPPEYREKRIFVVSADTLVETPVVVDFITRTMIDLERAASKQGIPLEVHRVVPKATETFWVNLLGRGYSAPTRTFRWCTERMKINPVNALIVDKVAQYGEVVIVLGARISESASRAQVIARHRVDGGLAKHTSLPNAYVYTPIKDWNADDVWEYLMSGPRPWGGDNRSLLELYRDSNSGECPVVIDTSTPSCGNSRFGCWTCTVVTKDKAMESLVEQGESWMRPLLDFRNFLAVTTQPDRKGEFRNYRRRTGKVSFVRGDLQDDGNRLRKHVPGPYWMRYRREWLERLLVLQRDLREGGHDVELISADELHEIRHEWRNDPNEPDWEDALPAIYRRVFGCDLDWIQNDSGPFSEADVEVLNELSETFDIPSTLVRKLLDLEVSMDGLAKRRGITDRIHAILGEDWAPLEITLAKGIRETDGGYQEEIDRLQEEVAELDDSPRP